VENVDTTLSRARGPSLTNKALEPYAWCVWGKSESSEGH